MGNLMKILLIPILICGLASATLSDEKKPWKKISQKFIEELPNSYFGGEEGNKENEMSYFNEDGDPRGNIFSFLGLKRLAYGFQSKYADSLINWTRKGNTSVFYISGKDSIRDSIRLDDSTETVIRDSLRNFYSRQQ